MGVYLSRFNHTTDYNEILHTSCQEHRNGRRVPLVQKIVLFSRDRNKIF